MKFNFNYLGMKHRVRFEDPGVWASNSMGRCHAAQGKIALHTNMPADIQAMTLMHELVHLVADHGGLEKFNEDETTVCVISTGLLAILRDNPKLANFLLTAGKT